MTSLLDLLLVLLALALAVGWWNHRRPGRYRYASWAPAALLLLLVLLVLLGLVPQAVPQSRAVNAVPTSTAAPAPAPSAAPSPAGTPGPALLPGQERWKAGVSSYLFGSNDSVDYSADNFVTDPHAVVHASFRSAGFTIMREFVFHYDLIDGHRATLGTTPQVVLNTRNKHEFDVPGPRKTTSTPRSPYGYELETRLRAIEDSGMQCLIVLPSIWTDASHPVDPNASDKIYVDPDTGKPETDLDFARKVVAYAGHRCNMYEIGNEPDLDEYTASGQAIRHMNVATYLGRWVEFVTALRQINPQAKFIGPVTYNDQGNDCYYDGHGAPPVAGAQSGDCYMRNFLLGAKAAGVYPDAVSFHWYPCSGATDGFDGHGNCGPAQAMSYRTVTREVKGWIQGDLGRSVPLLITEWNFDPGANPLGENGRFMAQFSQAAMAAMIAAGLDGAFQFDAQSYGGYGHLDMFDINNGDRPKAQFAALAAMIDRYRPRVTPVATNPSGSAASARR